MFIYMQPDSTEDQIEAVDAEVHAAGFDKTMIARGPTLIVINCLGSLARERKLSLREYFPSLPGVTQAEIVETPFRLTARQSHPDDFSVTLDGLAIGSREPIVVMAGPCAVESAQQLRTAAKAVKAAGAKVLRGGAYKPRTSVHSFQGLGEEGLKLLAREREEFDIPVVTEVMAPEKVELVAQYADCLQIGMRNMQNYDLLLAVGRQDKPVILKRNHAATIDEFLLAAEYIVSAGNPRVILCLRGMRGIGGDDKHIRNMSDLDMIPVLKSLTHHPVIFDPSHACGRRDLVPALAKAAVAVGADGLIIEVHPDADNARCDGAQSLYPDQFAKLMEDLRAIAAINSRSL